MIFHYQETDQTHGFETTFQKEVQCRKQAAVTQQGCAKCMGALQRNSSEYAIFQGERKSLSNPGRERKWESMINSTIESNKIIHES